MKYRLIQFLGTETIWDSVEDSQKPGCSFGHGYIQQMFGNKSFFVDVTPDRKVDIQSFFLRYDSPLFDATVDEVICMAENMV